MRIASRPRRLPQRALPLLSSAVLLASVTACVPIDTAPTARETVVIGPFAGHDAALHPANLAPHRIQFYGTDLGWTYQHGDAIQILFGDTWSDEYTPWIEASTGRTFDDGFGTIEAEQWADPARIDAAHIPLIRYGQHENSPEMSAINPGHAMEAYKTPVGGFSNGEREFGLFYVSKPQACISDADCSNGLVCDAGLGYARFSPNDDEGITLPCIDGAKECAADPMEDSAGLPMEGSGLCTDEGSSNWAESEVGRMSAMGLRHIVGLRSQEDPRLYSPMAEWLTTRFVNPAVRTVESFVPGQGTNRAAQDYRPARGDGPDRRVFLWGRPGFVGVGATGRDLAVYFAYADMPRAPDFTWTVRYFAGFDESGTPRFSAVQTEAAALDLDASQPGLQTEEIHDIVDQMSVAWIERLGKWVMLYGGGTVNVPREEMPRCGLLEFFAGPECEQVVVGIGAVYMRTADHPWGPWSPPWEVIVGGDPYADPPAYQHGPGGVLYHPKCVGETCARPTGDRVADDYGWFYGANIIPEWTTESEKGVNIFWNASTSNPYRVVLLKTTIE